MGDVVSSHLDEAKREMITVWTGKLMGAFGRLYEQQYGVALFNKVRFDVEGGGGPQPQLLHRKVPLENKSIFSGSIFQYIEENKKWKNRFLFVPDSYNICYYDNKSAYDKRLHPKGSIDCAGYKVLSSVEDYLDLISNSLPDMKAKVGGSPFLKFPNQFPLILWHPYARHYFFCVGTEKEQQKWRAVLQDCVRHANDGLCEEHKVQTPAFTDAVRLYRQAQGHYGTWEMMCGVPAQILSNLVMEGLLPELRELISPRLKGKLHERQRNWMLISDTVYSMVQAQCQAQYEAVLHTCEAKRSSLEASIRTDMDQIITSKEHVTSKIKAVVLPKAEKLLKVSIEPYISSILDALMEPTSRGFSEVRDVFFRELVEMSKNTLNNGTKEMVAQHMEKISMLAFHPVKMQSCYEKVEQLSLEGLQQRFDVSSPSVFIQRAQILMRKQMDDAVYTFEQILHQSLESQGPEDLCKTIQRCQDRVIKKFDYDSSTVRKRFFREALLQIFIPYMLKQLSPACASELPCFKELIFEDFSRFILVENIFEEVVLHSVMKDIMMAVKEAAVQRRHNLYRDSIVLTNSDPNLHLLAENQSIDWAEKYGASQEEEGEMGKDTEGEQVESQKRRRTKQVVSMIQEDGSVTPESCMEVPTVDVILEENSEDEASSDQNGSADPKESENPSGLTNGSALKEAEAEQKEQREGELLKVESAAGGAPVKVQEVNEEKAQPVLVTEEPPCSQVSEEAASPPPKEIPPETTGNLPDMSNSSTIKETQSQPEEQSQDIPLKVKSAAGGAPGEVEEVKEEKAQPVLVMEEPPCTKEVTEEAPPPPPKEMPPETTGSLPDMSNSSIINEKQSQPEEQSRDIPLKVESTVEGAPVTQEDQGKVFQLVVEKEPLGNQGQSEETPPEELPSETPEVSPENPPQAAPGLPLPSHDDSGFQSPTSEVVDQSSSTAPPQHSQELPVEGRGGEAAAANAE